MSGPPPGGGAAAGAAGDRRWPIVGLLLLPVLSFAISYWVFGYVIATLRDTRYAFFMFGRRFLGDFLDHPGGLLQYASRFLVQFYHYQWLGALVISLLIACFGVLFYLVLTRLRRTVWVFHTFLPCLLLLTLLQHNLVEVTLALMAICGAFLGYLWIPRRVARPVYTLLVIPALYFVIGGYFWFFITWVMVLEWLDKPRSSHRAFKLLYPAWAVCVALAAHRWLFLLPLSSALTYPANLLAFFESTLERVNVPSSVSAIVLIGYVLLAPFGERISWVRRLRPLRESRRDIAVRAVLLLVLAVLLLAISYDSVAKESSGYVELYRDKQWDAILDKAKGNPSPLLLPQAITNHALFRKGRLLEEMFSYAQVWGARGLVFNFATARTADPSESDVPRGMFNSDLFFEMGHVNAAFRHADNHRTEMGRTYENLKRLAECNMVNGNYALARKYLNILERTVFHRQFARHWKGIIADEEAADRHFAEARTRLPGIELDMARDNFIPMFTLLTSNRRNRAAFEYLMAWCLLDKASMPMIADHVSLLEDMGYASVPTHLQEAIVMLRAATRADVDTGGLRCDGDTVSRLREFAQQMSRYGDAASAASGLRGAFGGTYMYYWRFQGMPGGRNHAPAHYYLGNALRVQGKAQAAATHYGHTLRIEPRFVDGYIKLGHVLRSLGREAEAAAHYREALRLKPDSSEAREGLDRMTARPTDEGG